MLEARREAQRDSVSFDIADEEAIQAMERKSL